MTTVCARVRFAAGIGAGLRVTGFAVATGAKARSLAASSTRSETVLTSAPPPMTRRRKSSTSAIPPAMYAAVRQGRMRASGAASG